MSEAEGGWSRIRARNLAAMQTAVQRWVREAGARQDGAAALAQRAAWMERQLQALATSALRDEEPPSHLAGLTAFDLSAGLLILSSAADELAAIPQMEKRPMSKINCEPVDFYMLWTKSGWPPKRQHLTCPIALDEAKRLAEANPGKKFILLKAVQKVWVDDPALTDRGLPEPERGISPQ